MAWPNIAADQAVDDCRLARTCRSGATPLCQQKGGVLHGQLTSRGQHLALLGDTLLLAGM